MRGMARVLAALLLLSMLTTWASAGFLPEREHGQVTMEALETLEFDYAAFQDLCGDLMEAASGDGENVARLLGELREQYLLQDTLLAIASIHVSQDVTDQDAYEAYGDRLATSYDVEDAMEDAVQAVLESPYGDEVDRTDSVFSMFLWDTEPMTDRERELYAREQDLIDDYYAAANRVSQGDWNLRAPDGQGRRLARSGDDGNPGELADIYLDLVENRRAQAALYGWEDYGAMADEYTYGRDYTDISAFSRAVKTWIAPLASRLYDRVEALYGQGAYGTTFTEAQLLEALEEGLPAVSRELLPALNYMETYGFCDIGPSDVKEEGAYTTILPLTGAPYLFLNPQGDDYDFTSIVHEFGHYNAYFCSGDLYAYNVDLSEIHSQALELLMMDSYGTVFGEDAEAERLYTLYSILTSLVDGCMMDELERYAYSQADLTADMLNERYMQLLKDYGYRDPEDPETRAYDWVMTGHLYSQPLYYLSYAVSGAAALELWRQSLTDREGAVQTYLELVAQGESGDFLETLERAGLGNPLEEARLQSLAASVEEAALPQGEEADPENRRLLWIAFFGEKLLTTAWLLPTLYYRSRRKRRA